MSLSTQILRLARAAAVLTLLFSVATLPNHFDARLELFSHFRVQYFLAACLLIVVFFFLRESRWSLIMLALAALNAWPLAPYYVGREPASDAPAASLRLLHSNVYARNSDTRGLLDLIRRERPDIIFLQEFVPVWEEAMTAVHADYPYRLVRPRSDPFGIAAYSRIPFTRAEVIDSPPLGFPTLVVEVAVQDKSLTLISTHPMSPVSSDAINARNQQLQFIAEQVNASSAPVVLIGDLNTTMWGHHYRLLLEQSGLTDARLGQSVLPTWPAGFLPARIPIDHCLISDTLSVESIRVGPNIGSDHLPLIVSLGW